MPYMPIFAPKLPFYMLLMPAPQPKRGDVCGDLMRFYDRFCPCGWRLETISGQMGFLPQGTAKDWRGFDLLPLSSMRENKKLSFPARGGMGFLREGFLF